MIDLTSLRGKRVFITGLTGLIGTALRKMLPEGVHAYDPLRGPVPRGLADVIIHAAGYSAPDKFMADPMRTIGINTDTLVQMLARLARGGKFLFVSSSEVYSGSTKTSHAEDDTGHTSPWHPRASYIEGKRCGEAICAAFRAQYKHDVKVARVSLAYGPGTKRGDKRVLNSFIEQALTTGKIVMQDPGKAVRTYGYIDDIAEMLWTVLLHGQERRWVETDVTPIETDEPPVWNVAGKSHTTIRQLAEMIGDQLGVPVIAPPLSSMRGDAPAHVEADIGKYIADFGKPNFVSLEEGLRRTIEYQKGLYL